MSHFDSLMNDRVRVVKKDGRESPVVKAALNGKGSATLFEMPFPIDDGDILERYTSAGWVQRYVIIEAHFHEAMYDIPSSWELTLEKEGRDASRGSLAPAIIYNLTGPNARVNIGSLDSSTNVVNVTEQTLFSQMHDAIESGIADERRRADLQELVRELEAEKGKPSFLQTYLVFVSAIADHASLIAPFLPALSQLLTSI